MDKKVFFCRNSDHKLWRKHNYTTRVCYQFQDEVPIILQTRH